MPQPRSLALARHAVALVLAPLAVVGLLLLLLGYGLHGFPLAVANEDAGFDMPMAGHLNIPDTLIKGLDTKAFAITRAATVAEAESLYASGKVKALLAFPADLTKNMMIKQDDPSYVIPDKFKLEVAGRNPLASLFVIAAIARSSLAAMADSGAGPTADSLPIPLDVDSLTAGFSAAQPYILGAVLGWLTWLLTGILALVTASSLRRSGAFAGVRALPYAALFVIVFALAGDLLYLGLSVEFALVLGLALPAGLLPAALLDLLLFATAAGIGLAAATNAPSPERARPAIAYLVLPILLGGFLFPPELLPTWLQWLPYLFPPHYGLAASVAAQTGNFDSTSALLAGATALWALAFLALSAKGLAVAEATSAKEQV